MRYVLLAATAATLISTGAFAQDNTYMQQNQAHRAYAPVVSPTSPTSTAFPQGVISTERSRASAISEDDRLFLLQGDRGIGNG